MCWPDAFQIHELILHRAFGFDDRVFGLNCGVVWDRDWPPPQAVAKFIRSPISLLLKVVQAILIFTKLREPREILQEGSANGNKTTAEELLAEYQRRLEDMFGNSRLVIDLVSEVKDWTKG